MPQPPKYPVAFSSTGTLPAHWSDWRNHAANAGWRLVTAYDWEEVRYHVTTDGHKLWVDLMPGRYNAAHDLFLFDPAVVIVGLGPVFWDGHGLRVHDTKDVLIGGIDFRDSRVDGIEIHHSNNVRVERCGFMRWGDEAIAIKNGSRDIALQGLHLRDGVKGLLIGHTDGDEDRAARDSRMTVTAELCYFGPNIGMRCPRVRYATVGMKNCVIDEWDGTAIDASMGASVHLHGVHFRSSKNATRIAVNSGAHVINHTTGEKWYKA